MKRFILILFAGVSLAYGQNPGDQIFEIPQILTVDLQFDQPGFWDSLVANYATETYMAADVTITDATGTYVFPDIAIRLKGNSSYGHPGNKKSFKIDFNKYVDGQDYDGLIKLNFSNNFKDPTFMRENIMLSISNDAGVPASRYAYANVYMNGTFWGFYGVMEQIDDDFLNTHFGNSSENLFKAGAAFGMGTASADLHYYGTDTASYSERYSLENNAAVNDWTDLFDLTYFIDNSSDADFAAQLGDHFNVDILMKSLALDNVFANLDSYINSARNYYIYHDPDTGNWQWIKWDCNEAFGTYSGGGPGGGGVTDMTTLEPDYYVLDRPLLERILNIPETRNTYDYYYCLMRATYFTYERIDSMIDALYPLIAEAVYADDEKMYTNDQFDTNLYDNITTGGGPGGGTIYGLRSFVSQRNEYLDAVLTCDVLNAVEDVAQTDIFLFPNPVSDILQIQCSGDFTSWVIRDISGRQVLCNVYCGRDSFTVDVKDLTAGLYYFSLYTEKGCTTSMFVHP